MLPLRSVTNLTSTVPRRWAAETTCSSAVISSHGSGRAETEQRAPELDGRVAGDLADGGGVELGAVAVARQVLDALQRGVVQRGTDLALELGDGGAALRVGQLGGEGTEARSRGRPPRRSARPDPSRARSP